MKKLFLKLDTRKPILDARISIAPAPATSNAGVRVSNFEYRVSNFAFFGIVLTLAALLLFGATIATSAQQIVDRIVARVEGDIITQSELRELAAFERLVADSSARRAAADSELLGRAIEQWIVATEATAARYPRPSPEDVDREMTRLEKSLAEPGHLAPRLRQAGLTRAALARLLERQLFLARYLDYKFRPAAQVEPEAIRRHYEQKLLPVLRGKGQPIPTLDDVQDQIRELLVQMEISARAARWLDETRSRLRIQIEPEASAR